MMRRPAANHVQLVQLYSRFSARRFAALVGDITDRGGGQSNMFTDLLLGHADLLKIPYAF